MAGRRALVPLSDRRFRRMFVAQTVSYVGSAATPVALSFAVLDLTRSATALGLVNAAAMVPLVVCVLLGGVVGDRVRRNRLMVAANLVLAAVRAATAALVLSGTGGTASLAACAAVGGFATAFLLPATQAVIPEVAPAGHLREANALLRLSRNGAGVFGAALGGLAVAAVGPGWALVWDAASYVVAASLLAGLAIDAPARRPATRLTVDLRLGWAEFWSRPWLWAIVVQFCFVNAAFAAGFQLLGPVVAKRSLGGPGAWGLTLGGLAAGYVLGGFVALRWRTRRPLLVGTLGVLAMAGPVVALAAAWPLAALVGAAVCAGIGLEQFGVGWSTVMQDRIPADRLSRVAAYDMLGSFVAIPVGFALGGPLVAAVGARPTAWAAAAVIVAATLAVLCSRQVRTIGPQAPPGPGPGGPGATDAALGVRTAP